MMFRRLFALATLLALLVSVGCAHHRMCCHRHRHGHFHRNKCCPAPCCTVPVEAHQMPAAAQ